MRKTVAIGMFLVVAGTVPAQRTLVVPTQYSTIQAAVDAAASNDTVLVLPGRYGGGIIIQGKNITLTSRDGPAVTVINGGGPVVALFGHSGPGQTTVQGFTIQGGRAESGAGIGIAGGKPMIIGNIITNNSASYQIFRKPGLGGGIGPAFFGPADAIVVNNVIARNAAYGTANGFPAYGGGAWLSPNSIVANNTFVLNTAQGVVGRGEGGGLYAPGVTATNCVFWLNTASSTGPHLSGATAVNCLVGVDPKLMDAVLADYHIRHDSPARDKGIAVPSLPATDWEGDPRLSGSALDIGADEFHPHLYATGSPTPGGILHIKIIGVPNTTAVWAYSLNPALRVPPVMIPGFGNYYLHDPIFLNPAGTIPPTGLTIVPIPLPSALPKPLDIPIQALIGSGLSNPFVVRIR